MQGSKFGCIKLLHVVSFTFENKIHRASGAHSMASSNQISLLPPSLPLFLSTVSVRLRLSSLSLPLCTVLATYHLNFGL